MGMAKTLQAKHISDADYLAAIDEVNRQGPYSAACWSVAMHLGIPMKVSMAKARKLINRKLIGGCSCGCSSVFWKVD